MTRVLTRISHHPPAAAPYAAPWTASEPTIRSSLLRPSWCRPKPTEGRDIQYSSGRIADSSLPGHDLRPLATAFGAKCGLMTILLVAGPLHAETLVRDLGSIEFPNSGAAAAQPAFVRGILLLHSFEYEDAAEEFRSAQKIDPDFALAYWGEAMTYNHPIWNEENVPAARAALARLGSTPADRRAKAETEKEKGFLDAIEILYGEGDCTERRIAYSEALGNLRKRFAHDHEIASFYALSILGTVAGRRDIPTYMRAAAVGEEVYQSNPRHPGALHYLIHSYDDPIHAPLGLRMARRYDKVAPAAAHALHMPSHIYVALGLWKESADANERSSGAADERRARKGLSIEARGYHSLLWLEYSYLQLGRVAEARQLLERMAKDAAESGSARTRFHLARMRAAYLVELPEGEGLAASVRPDTRGLRPTAVAADLFVTGRAALRRRDRAKAVEALALFEGLRTPVPPVSLPTVTAGMAGCCLPAPGPGSKALDRGAVRAMELQLAALLQEAAGNSQQALRLADEAGAAEDALPFDFGPPRIVKPAHEFRGDLLLGVKRPVEAQRAFERALQRVPRRSASLLGLARAARAAGDKRASRRAYRELARIWSRADAELPALREVRQRAGVGD